MVGVSSQIGGGGNPMTGNRAGKRTSVAFVSLLGVG